MYQLSYEPWNTAGTCIYDEKQVTSYNLDKNQGGFAELLAYYGAFFKFLCVVLFLITIIEVFLIYLGKRQRPCKLRLRTLNKLIISRRIACLVMAKVGFVIVSYMASYAESDKFV